MYFVRAAAGLPPLCGWEALETAAPADPRHFHYFGPSDRLAALGAGLQEGGGELLHGGRDSAYSLSEQNV